VAVALARAGFRQVTTHATLLLVVAGNLPDIDVLAVVRGQLAAFEIHCGYTHSLIALPVVALIAVLLSSLLARERLPFVTAWLVTCVGVGSHLLLDWTGSYGIRALLPFSSRWFYLDLNGFYDGVILAALTLALVWPWFVDLVSSEIGRKKRIGGQGSAILILLFLGIYEGGRWTLHEQAVNELNSRIYDGEVPREVSALPEPNNPFEWTGIVETEDAFRMVSVKSLNFNDASDARVFHKPAQSPVYLAAKQLEAFRYMSYFARFPVWDIEPIMLHSDLGERLDMTDLRFGTPGSGEIHASALADAAGQIVESQFGFTTRAMDEMFANVGR
jgi:inner membrane protein